MAYVLALLFEDVDSKGYRYIENLSLDGESRLTIAFSHSVHDAERYTREDLSVFGDRITYDWVIECVRYYNEIYDEPLPVPDGIEVKEILD